MSTRRPVGQLIFSGLLLLCLLISAPPVRAQSGLVGWWKLDEGSGTTAADSSGGGHSGTLVNSPTWSSGHTGPGALTFSSTSELTASGSGGLANLYSGGLTVSAWIYPTGSGGGGGGRIVDKDNNDGGWFFAMSGTTAVKFTSDQDTTGSGSRTSATSIVLNTWQHVLVTWTGAAGGTNMHIYINGVQADGGTTTATGPETDDSATPVTIGNRQVDTARGFAGAIDDVRIYNRVLTATEIQALADATAPSAPSGVVASALSSSQVNLSWTASTDNTGVTGYLVERCQGAGCSNFAQIATPSTNSYNDTGLSSATSYTYRLRATDAAGNLSSYSSSATVTTQSGSDTTPPSVPTGLTASAASSTQITLSWIASTDNVAVTGYKVERCQGAGCTSFSQIGTPTSTSYSDSGLTASTTYVYRVRATDVATNLSGYSATASATTSASGSTGPVSWWRFDEGAGTTAADASGLSNTATLVNSPTWSTGRVGPYAVTFNGGTSEVTANGSGSLANLYTTGLTVSVWIYPTSAGGGSLGRIVDKDNNDSGWFLAMAATDKVKLTSDQDTTGSSSRTSSSAITLNTWQHVVATWTGAAGGANMHIYVNGVLADGVTTDGVGPEVSDVTTPVTIGNRALDKARGFAGALDDVRIYNRVLSASEIQALANPTAPGAPASLSVGASSSAQVNLTWTPATSSAGIANYLVERCSGGSCTSFAQIGTTVSSTPSYFDASVTPSANFTYRVRANDLNGALGPYSNTTSVVTPAEASYPCTSTGSIVCYFYDEVGRLKVAQRSDGLRQTYLLDAAGNRLSMNQVQVSALQFQQAAYPVNNSAGTVALMVTRTGGLGNRTTVNYTTVDGTAKAGTQYMASQGTLAWNPGDGGNQTISVPIVNTGVSGPDTAFTVSLSQPVGGVIVGSDVQVTIHNTTPPPNLALSPTSYPVQEGNTSVTVNVVRTGQSAGTVQVSYATSDGTAVAGVNYTATSGTLNWGNNETGVKSFSVPVRSDGVYSDSKVLNITLSSPGGSPTLPTLGATHGTITIANTDPKPPQIPTAPTGVSATAVSKTQIDLSWIASTEPGGSVSGYRIYRGGALLGTTSSTSYSDTTASARTTYFYTVIAYDPAGRTSNESSPAAFATTWYQITDNSAVATLPGVISSASSRYSSSALCNGYPPKCAWVVAQTFGSQMQIYYQPMGPSPPLCGPSVPLASGYHWGPGTCEIDAESSAF